MAMLVLLAGTAGARLVATDLRFVTHRRRGGRAGAFCRISLRSVRRHRRCGGMLEPHALGHLLGLAAQTRFFFGRIVATYLYMGQHADGIATDAVEQLLEQIEGLALVFLLG